MVKYLFQLHKFQTNTIKDGFSRTIFFLKYCIYFFVGYIYSIGIQVYAEIIPIVSPSSQLPGQDVQAGDFIGNIIAQFIGVVAVLTILAVTWAGIQMVLAIGEEEKMKKARHTMIYAFIGLGVSGLSYGIVTFITSLKLDTFF